MTARAVTGVGDDQMLIMLGGLEACGELESDPRYLIGRLQQALTALLSHDVPPMDATAELLAEAVRDAIDYRRHDCPHTPDGSICDTCRPDWNRASAYEVLWRELGIFGERPRPRDLKAVTS